MNKDSIILMSGGLDSLVALSEAIRQQYDVKLAITFDYGQKSLSNEIKSSESICKYYNVKHKIVKLGWLNEISSSSVVQNFNGSETDNSSFAGNNLWVPNRNSLFLNIAASFCDAYNYKFIFYGSNEEEAEKFSDNTVDFLKSINVLFETSTQVHPEVIAPLINYNKDDIVKIALKNHAPIEYVYSCYESGEKHCGECESCIHLKNALKKNNCKEYISLLFE